jgi:hypothetical protein
VKCKKYELGSLFGVPETNTFGKYGNNKPYKLD